jgi:putative endonuclease
MIFTVYILFSKSTQKYYTGSTQDLQNRLLEHNSAETKSIRNGIPWEVIWQTQVPSRADAMNLESKIKKEEQNAFSKIYRVALRRQGRQFLP